MRNPDSSQIPKLANGADSFMYMKDHIDDITNPNHPAKRYRENAKQLSMAYYMANSTERQTEVYQQWKKNYLNRKMEEIEKPAGVVIV